MGTKGRDQSGTSTNQGKPKIARKPPEDRKEAWDIFAHRPWNEPTLLTYLDLGLLASRTLRPYISVP